MKRILAICLIAGLAGLCFPSRKVLGQTARPVAGAEAQTAAKRLWDSILTTCDNQPSYFHDGRNEGSEIWGGLVEFRDVHFYVFPIEVSRADQLNGIRWHAAAIMIAEAYRSASLGPEGTAKEGWGPFRSGEPLGDVKYGAKYMSNGTPLVTSKKGTIAFVEAPDALHPQPAGWFVVGMEQRGETLFYKWAWSDERRSEEIAHLKPACSLFPGTHDFQLAQLHRQGFATFEEAKAKGLEDKKIQAEADARLAAAKEADARSKVPISALEKKTQSDGFWIDSRTNLMWTAKDSANNLSYEGAGAYCRNLRLSDYSDWRLPALDELEKLYDPSKSHDGAFVFYRLVFQYHIAGGIMLSGGRAMSNSPAQYKRPDRKQWSFSFVTGERTSTACCALDCPALCVREVRNK